jgi:Bacterial archaeo-eukaryotic release factor family 10
MLMNPVMRVTVPRDEPRRPISFTGLYVERVSVKGGQMANKIHAGSLSDLQVPLLTAYINTNPANSGNRGLIPGYAIWLRQVSKSFAPSILPAELEIFQAQIRRVEDFLRTWKAGEKSLVILSGPKEWNVFPLQIAVQNDIQWGRPALAQLFSLQSAHKPSLIAVVDRAGARFFQYFLGEWTALGEMKFELDMARWKRKDIGHLAHPGIKTTRGSQRDTFEHRVDAQYVRLCRQAAKQVETLSQQKRANTIFLVGLPRLVEPIKSQLSKELQHRAVLVKDDLGRLTPPRLESRLATLISDWENQHGTQGLVRPSKQDTGKAYSRNARA